MDIRKTKKQVLNEITPKHEASVGIGSHNGKPAIIVRLAKPEKITLTVDPEFPIVIQVVGTVRPFEVG